MVLTVREKVLNILGKEKITDDEGFATRKLSKKVPGVTMGSLSTILRKMEQDGEIERQVDNKRCYMIKLADGYHSNGKGPISEVDLIEGIINAVAKLKAENQDQATEIEGLKAELATAKASLQKARNELEQKQLEIAGLHRQVEAAQRDAQVKTKASDQLSKLREMLEM